MEFGNSHFLTVCTGLRYYSIWSTIYVYHFNLFTYILLILNCLQYQVQQIPALSLPDVCTNQPRPGQAFCEQHCHLMQQHTPPIPTDIRGFLRHCGVLKGQLYLKMITVIVIIIFITDDVQPIPDDIEGSVDKLIEETLDATAISDVGQSAAASQGFLFHCYDYGL